MLLTYRKRENQIQMNFTYKNIHLTIPTDNVVIVTQGKRIACLVVFLKISLRKKKKICLQQNIITQHNVTFHLANTRDYFIITFNFFCYLSDASTTSTLLILVVAVAGVVILTLTGLVFLVPRCEVKARQRRDLRYFTQNG